MNDRVDIELHLRAFAESFALETRKDKWVDLLSKRPVSIRLQSSKLFNHLDHNYIEQNDSLEHVAPNDQVGVFYNFIDKPKCISFKEAIAEGNRHDALFSISPGKLVVCFCQDGWNFVCKR